MILHPKKNRTLRKGVMALANILYKNLLHPKAEVDYMAKNRTDTFKLIGATLLTSERIVVKGEWKDCVTLQHDKFDQAKLHCCWNYAVITKEGDPLKFFDIRVSATKQRKRLKLNINQVPIEPVIKPTDGPTDELLLSGDNKGKL